MSNQKQKAMATKTVAKWIEGLDLTVNSTVSKKVTGATVKKTYKPGSFGFDKLGLKIARVDAWAKAELDGVEYLVVVHTPKPRNGGEPIARTFYKKAESAQTQEAEA